MKHEWECENCGRFLLFRQPELPSDDYRSECQESKKCAYCGSDMYFDEVFVPPVKELNVPTPEDIAKAKEDEEDEDAPV